MEEENNSLEIDIVNKIKNLLKIDEDITLFDLANKLYDYRKKIHPDNFLDNELKRRSHDKFIECNNLYNELSKKIENTKLNSSYKDLIKADSDFQLISIQKEFIQKDKIIEEYESQIKRYENIAKKLIKQLSFLSKNESKKLKVELHNLYKKDLYIKIGLSLKIFLGLTFFIVSSISKISEILYNFIPFSQVYANWGVFSILIISIIINLYQMLKKNFIKNEATNLENSLFLAKFSNNLEDKNNFKESFVSKYLLKYFNAQKGFFNFLKKKIFKIYTPDVIEQYKNIFINNMFEKHLIEISAIKNLDKEFKIKGSAYYSMEEFDADKEFARLLNSETK